MTEALFCPIRNRPLAGALRVVRGALSVRCKFCGEIHLIRRVDLNEQWDALEQKGLQAGEDDLSSPITPSA